MLENITDCNKKKRIFCYLNGAHHFDLFYNIFKMNPEIDFFIHSRSITLDDYRKSRIYGFDNAYFITDFASFKYKTGCFGAFITTDIQSCLPHEYSLKLAYFFKQLRIPVIELQHRLFQLGLHYYDRPAKEIFHDDSLPVRSLADHILTYYPLTNYSNTTTIGYPPFAGTQMSYRGEYTLILSNLHWETYTGKEKYNFYRTVCEFAANNPAKMFLWKMHHGETANPQNHKLIEDLFSVYPEARENIVFYHNNSMLQKTKLSALISKADAIISTVSTVLLDCEMYGKSTFVYKCPSCRCLTDRLKNAGTFGDYKELAALTKHHVSAFETGFLYPYDNKAFVREINSLYKTPDISAEAFLRILLE